MQTQLTDDTLEAYIAWREERAGVWHAYRRWSAASVDDAVSAFSAYQAALDREEKASWVYADLLARLEHALRKSPPNRDRGSRHGALT
jgi:hypothetical protein